MPLINRQKTPAEDPRAILFYLFLPENHDLAEHEIGDKHQHVREHLAGELIERIFNARKVDQQEHYHEIHDKRYQSRSVVQHRLAQHSAEGVGGAVEDVDAVGEERERHREHPRADNGQSRAALYPQPRGDFKYPAQPDGHGLRVGKDPPQQVIRAERDDRRPDPENEIEDYLLVFPVKFPPALRRFQQLKRFHYLRYFPFYPITPDRQLTMYNV